MRGDIIFEVFGVHEGREKDTYFSAFRTPEEAHAKIERLRTTHGTNWAQEYHNKGFVIREKIVETDFELPSRPKPRDKYFVTCSAKANRPGSWDSSIVNVFRRSPTSGTGEFVCEYERNYAMLQTFEPFRQGTRTCDYETLCLTPAAQAPDNSAPPQFIRVSKYKGMANVKFAVEMTFDLDTGGSQEWQRLRIKNFD